MQLNVYIISHPLLQNLAHKIINYQTNKTSNNYTDQANIGQLMVYEAIRKWSRNEKMYVKTLHTIKEIQMFHPQDSYILIADLTHSYDFLSKIPELLPKIHLIHYNLDIKNTLDHNSNIIQLATINNNKIIIITEFLNNYSIINLLEYLVLKKHVTLKQIRIICITCHNKILDKLGQHYPHLHIYTTKIINT
uniref:Uracil phosphoribosyltransferase n=1 Tax=Asparagopsis taxiformis TaxID=260499 RepID=A0A1C9CCB1_9FLOR|nr:uracil phosphoribosyltransferase [Asparagopsis taxiformis]AOM66019.1 uracil phosphoribosyltransferase [Asparagopsis taxiformis]